MRTLINTASAMKENALMLFVCSSLGAALIIGVATCVYSMAMCAKIGM
jgi:hypothetical protein